MTSVAAGPIPGEQVDAREYFEDYPLEAIIESPLNPRQHYDPKALQELADSLRENTQLTPALVRPMDGVDSLKIGGLYWLPVEIAAGHRRFRALKLAGIPTMRLVRQQMTDQQFVEALQIENLQRDNLHPLEEARGFRSLMDVVGYDLNRIAARVGRTRSYVYDRLKLLQLVPDAQTLFLAGRFELGHAVVLARLGPSDQERAIESRRSGNGRIGGLFVREEALLTDDEEDALEEQLDAAEDSKDPAARTVGLKPVSVREFQGWIDRHVRFRPEAEDLPSLFPVAAIALEAAAQQELKVVKITRDHLVADEAKDPSERTYGNRAWKRADGVVAEPLPWNGKVLQPATCDHAVMGVVVAGPGRGEAFKVCFAKKTCTVHWAAEQREAAKRAKEQEAAPASSGRGQAPVKKELAPPAELVRSWQEAEVAAEAERLTPKVLATIKDIPLPDDIAWNLAGVVANGDGMPDWAPVGKRPEGWASGAFMSEITAVLTPKLPGKWDPKDHWCPQRDATAARSALALAVCLARDFGEKGAKAVNGRLDGRRRQWVAAQAKPAAESKGVQKKGAAKGKAKKKLAGDVRRAKAKKKRG